MIPTVNRNWIDLFVEFKVKNQAITAKERINTSISVYNDIKIRPFDNYLIIRFINCRDVIRCLQLYDRSVNVFAKCIRFGGPNNFVIGISGIGELLEKGLNENEIEPYIMERASWTKKQNNVKQWDMIVDILKNFGEIIDITRCVDKTYITFSNFYNSGSIVNNQHLIIGQINTKAIELLNRMVNDCVKTNIIKIEEECERVKEEKKQIEKRGLQLASERIRLINKICRNVVIEKEKSGYAIEVYLPSTLEITQEVFNYFESFGPMNRFAFRSVEDHIRIISIVYIKKESALKCFEENNRCDVFNIGLLIVVKLKFLTDGDFKIYNSAVGITAPIIQQPLKIHQTQVHGSPNHPMPAPITLVPINPSIPVTLPHPIKPIGFDESIHPFSSNQLPLPTPINSIPEITGCAIGQPSRPIQKRRTYGGSKNEIKIQHKKDFNFKDKTIIVKIPFTKDAPLVTDINWFKNNICDIRMKKFNPTKIGFYSNCAVVTTCEHETLKDTLNKKNIFFVIKKKSDDLFELLHSQILLKVKQNGIDCVLVMRELPTELLDESKLFDTLFNVGDPLTLRVNQRERMAVIAFKSKLSRNIFKSGKKYQIEEANQEQYEWLLEQ